MCSFYRGFNRETEATSQKMGSICIGNENAHHIQSAPQQSEAECFVVLTKNQKNKRGTN